MTVSWTDFAAAEPELAAGVRARFAGRKHATMATVRRDGSPRISGTEVEFDDDGEVYVAMMPGTRRAADLRRDRRMALHSPSVDPTGENGSDWPGEAKLDAVAVEVAPDRFRLDLVRAVLTEIDGAELRITSWTPDGGRREARRD